MQRTVTTTGHGTADVVPDSAVVRVHVRHRAPSVAEALDGLARVGATLGEVARRHVAAGAIASTGMDVHPAHDHQGRHNGFEAGHQWRLSCDDLSTASALVAALAEGVGDALRIEHVGLRVADPSAAVARARERAFADARARAVHLATLGGRSLGDLLSVGEGDQGRPDGDGPARFLAAELDFTPGEQEVGGRVTATWQLL